MSLIRPGHKADPPLAVTHAFPGIHLSAPPAGVDEPPLTKHTNTLALTTSGILTTSRLGRTAADAPEYPKCFNLISTLPYH